MECKRMDEAPDGGLDGTLVLPHCLAPTVDETNNLGFYARSALLSVSVCLLVFLSLCLSICLFSHLSGSPVLLYFWPAGSLSFSF